MSACLISALTVIPPKKLEAVAEAQPHISLIAKTADGMRLCVHVSYKGHTIEHVQDYMYGELIKTLDQLNEDAKRMISEAVGLHHVIVALLCGNAKLTAHEPTLKARLELAQEFVKDHRILVKKVASSWWSLKKEPVQMLRVFTINKKTTCAFLTKDDKPLEIPSDSHLISKIAVQQRMLLDNDWMPLETTNNQESEPTSSAHIHSQ